jgi:RNA polymerase sigma-70 factor, ECF subfamily
MLSQVKSLRQPALSLSAYRDLPDCELIRCCQSNDNVAFKELVRRCESVINTLLFRYAPDWQDRSDLMQEVLIRVWRGIGNLKSPQAFRAWLNQIVANLFYDEVRKRSRRITPLSLDQALEGDDGPARDVEDSSAGPDEVCSQKEIEQMVGKGMSVIPIQFRKAVSLRAMGLSYEEIAVATKSDLGTVKSRISRARTKLLHILKPYLDGNDDENVAA